MKKSKSKNVAKKNPASKKMEHEAFDAALASLHAVTTSAADRRKELLARVAGSIAVSLVSSPTPDIATPAGIATAAVDIAEEILKKAGIPVEPAAEASSSAAADVGAAS